MSTRFDLFENGEEMKNSIFLRRFSLLLVVIVTSGVTSWLTVAEAHIHADTHSVVVSGNMNPSKDNVYSLGTEQLRWKGLQLGPGTLFIQDQETGDQAGITVKSGSLLIDGADSLRVGNIQLTATGIKTLTPNSDLTIGDVTGTGKIKLARALEFPDGTIQETAAVEGSVGKTGEQGIAGEAGAKGDTGMSGGPQGFTGAQGKTGTTGATGAPGVSGTSGYTARSVCIVKTTGVMLFGTCSALKKVGTTSTVLMK
jgi:hypothetical protein